MITTLSATAADVPGWLLLPFVLMLLTIALAPVLFERFWEENRNKLIVALAIGIPTAGILFYRGLGENLVHTMLIDYIPFIILLGGLFAVTGGIRITGDLRANPAVNTAFLGIGAILASIMGTTGAAMLLIRPLMETNAERKHKTHTILFFIAVVANCGGILTPLGDPPLFLLYLRGAHFSWFLHMLPEWATINAILLLVYYLMDCRSYKRESLADLRNDRTERTALKVSGTINFLWLLGIVLAVAFVNEQYIPSMGGEGITIAKFYREFVIVLMIVLSLLTTPKGLRAANRFTWHPILEVAYLFIGIFITMTPALLFLTQHAPTLGLTSPKHFFFATGALSGFLDNAPTALAFYSVAQGLPEAAPIVAGVNELLLTAISLGAVLFGAMTYIGNGPNFMVKAIAEENGIKMPSFFRYMTHFSLIILLPIYILVAMIFL